MNASGNTLPSRAQSQHDISGPRRGLMNPAERRSSPGALGPDFFIRGSGEGGLFMSQWIDGDELLRARWSNITGLLLRAIRARTIQPFNKITLDPVTLDTDPCLFCGHPGEGAESCPHAITHLAPGQDIEALAAGHMNLLPAVCRQGCAPESLDRRVRGYAFLRSEVEAFEQAQGAGAQSTKANAPADQFKVKLEKRLTRQAQDFAKKAGERITKLQLRVHLVESGTRDTDLSDRLLRKIWEQLPQESKNLGGRPRKSE